MPTSQAFCEGKTRCMQKQRQLKKQYINMRLLKFSYYFSEPLSVLAQNGLLGLEKARKKFHSYHYGINQRRG